ncbi:hypothetical protein EYC84_003520 [Monilinia fructicola]|uniref:Uncharacterized protein n=1 Tax=Monilinia fructicola TaxID=38448 RepID=A0A5M9JTW8_MONFR|nr:hypothetical protein EYC84_003520 [Monilinia fructicola]
MQEWYTLLHSYTATQLHKYSLQWDETIRSQLLSQKSEEHSRSPEIPYSTVELRGIQTGQELEPIPVVPKVPGLPPVFYTKNFRLWHCALTNS